jgi:acyl-CoA thioesterase FadM
VIDAAVRPQDLDPLGHVNNGAYLDYLEEAVLAAGVAGEAATRAIPRTVRLEYVAPAGPGMRLRGAAWPERAEGGAARWAWRITSADDGRELARGRLIDGEPHGS